MKTGIVTSAQKPILITIIFINIIAVLFVFRILFQRISLSAEAPFKYGNQAPELNEKVTIRGHSIRIVPDDKILTILMFFNDSHIGHLQKFNARGQSYNENNFVQLIGIFHGNSKSLHDLTSDKSFQLPVISDNWGKIHQLYHFYPPPQHGGTLVLDKNLKVLLSIPTIIRADLLEDFINRHTQSASNTVK